ncbi:MAG: class I SAM-dependent RNA methyltransferase [Bacteriovoracaceae bacterium]|nr:class I SAM-dependent RNA methyltransferase [Bacteriovoracaceae bacterium]
MAQKLQINFLIDHIDPLGQGVFKLDDQVYFIPKTLPGEKGLAEVLKSRKNIHFCKVIKIDQLSTDRITPECPHFNECPGCHYLNVDYKEELEFKKASFKRMLAPIGSPEFETVQAPNRLNYRNRVQLHYHKRAQKLGFINGNENKIVEVPNCKIYRPELETSFKELYAKRDQYLRKRQRPKGHVELYLRNNEQPQINWDKSYAADGFTQVNHDMNLKLLDSVAQALEGFEAKTALDLFGGDGNLSKAAKVTEIFHIDRYPFEQKDNFHSLDLSTPESLEEFARRTNLEQAQLFIVDPPRAGFKHLSQWVEHFRPQMLIYVSCHPQTMIRDLRALDMPYEIVQTKLLDLFPSTFHFEAMSVLRFK